ncbi:MAG: reverse transcriptase family protein, partial [Candidatus Uhrbacteria bacterium]
MKTKRATHRRRQRGEWKCRDFQAVLALPERLAMYLRLLLHLDKPTWDFCLDKLRQEHARQAAYNPAANSGKPYRCGIAYRMEPRSKGKGRGVRWIAAPCEELKLVQRAILQRFLGSIPVHFCRHGNQRGASIVTNALHHVGFAKAVFSVDIINAFPSVFRSRIRANLRKPFAYVLRQFAGVTFPEAPESVRAKFETVEDVPTFLREYDFDFLLEALVDLVCLHDRLPQGPPTSPRILDVVCMKMDEDIWGLLHASSTPLQSFRYTAWADDLTISSDDEIPEELRTAILGNMRDNGFIPHTREDKTKYFSPETGEVAVVTGIVLNRDGRLTMAPRKVNQLRARLYHFAELEAWDDAAFGVVAGTIGYIRQIYPKNPPSKLRAVVGRIEARMQALQAARVAAHTIVVASLGSVPSNGEAPKSRRKRQPSKG